MERARILDAHADLKSMLREIKKTHERLGEKLSMVVTEDTMPKIKYVVGLSNGHVNLGDQKTVGYIQEAYTALSPYIE
jgi:hypothetical protein